jgi:regulation of enolase protein 1 (concanavalin A-like superfamily)
LPDAYRSIWEGSISNDTETRRVRITLSGGDLGTPIGVVDYPDSGRGCGGLVTLESLDDGSIRLSEAIDYGTCDWATASLTLSKTAIDTLDLRWEGPEGVFVGQLSDNWGFLGRPTASIELVGPDAQGEVQLSASLSTTPAGTEPLTFAWDFGDESSSTEAATVHEYAPGVYLIQLTVTNVAGLSAVATTVVTIPCASGVVAPWAAIDLGAPLVPGGEQIDGSGAGSCWTLCAGGRGFQGPADEGRFLYQEVDGDFVLTVKLDEFLGGVLTSQAGLMARESSDASDPSARQGSLFVLGNRSLASTRRARASNSATQRTLESDDRWLRLQRSGGAVLGSHSPDGAQWTPLDSPLLDGIVAAKLLIGLAASARVPATQKSYPATQARFCEVHLERSTSGPIFRRGDTNDDGKADISDAVTTLAFLFLGGPTKLECDKAADTNDDGRIDLSDPVALLNHLFLGAPAPPAPFVECGLDPTEDALTCEGPGPCL